VNVEGQAIGGHRPLDLRALYGDAAYARLVDVKRRLDHFVELRVNSGPATLRGGEAPDTVQFTTPQEPPAAIRKGDHWCRATSRFA
jgi:hypothetical protein